MATKKAELKTIFEEEKMTRKRKRRMAGEGSGEGWQREEMEK